MVHKENEKDGWSMTNGDRIRSMANDELTQFVFSRDCTACMHCIEYRREVCGYPECSLIRRHEVFVKWLNSESETLKH